MAQYIITELKVGQSLSNRAVLDNDSYFSPCCIGNVKGEVKSMSLSIEQNEFAFWDWVRRENRLLILHQKKIKICGMDTVVLPGYYDLKIL